MANLISRLRRLESVETRLNGLGLGADAFLASPALCALLARLEVLTGMPIGPFLRSPVSADLTSDVRDVLLEIIILRRTESAGDTESPLAAGVE